MSIIIKGETMPECCAECPCMRHDNWNGGERYQCNVTLIYFGEFDSWRYERRPNWCPLVELPEKHGRLIDADDATRGSLERTGKRLLAIDTAPTVVEAEGE